MIQNDEPSFPIHLIEKDSYLLELSRYIHLNPVKAGMVEKPQDYPHSSYKSYVETKEDEFVVNELILDMMSKKRKLALAKYRSFVEGINMEFYGMVLKGFLFR